MDSYFLESGVPMRTLVMVMPRAKYIHTKFVNKKKILELDFLSFVYNSNCCSTINDL